MTQTLRGSMDLIESYVLAYLTAKKHVFVNPQFSIRNEKGGDWSCPDFVTIDFKCNEVAVVEVSTNSDPRVLVDRVRDAEKQWMEKLRVQLEQDSVISPRGAWAFVIKLFVRAV